MIWIVKSNGANTLSAATRPTTDHSQALSNIAWNKHYFVASKYLRKMANKFHWQHKIAGKVKDIDERDVYEAEYKRKSLFHSFSSPHHVDMDMDVRRSNIYGSVFISKNISSCNNECERNCVVAGGCALCANAMPTFSYFYCILQWFN